MPQLEQVQFTRSGDVLARRPDKLRAHRLGGHSEVALHFDGKSVSAFDKSIDGYAQSPIIDKMFECGPIP